MSPGGRGPTRAGAKLTLGELAQAAGAELAAGPAQPGPGNPAGRPVESYAIDSRDVEPGSVFFALTGARTDGHAHLAEVAARGALAAVVRPGTVAPPGITLLQAPEPVEALRRLGAWFRHRWPLRVVGITGSAGKTTTKEFAAALLAGERPVFKSTGNLNSTIGLPLTLLARRPEEEVAVLELGMSTPGELALLARLAEPDVAVVTNVGLAHVGNFRSADDIAREKESILAGLRPGGSFVANADDHRVRAMAGRFPGRVVTFGRGAEAEVRAEEIEACGPDGTRFRLRVGERAAAAHLPLAGVHHVLNALAALAVARALGHDPLALVPALARLEAGEHRGRVRRLAGEVLLLDDCYNSSPTALGNALDALATLPGRRRLAVLGDMLELGALSEDAHREAGRHAALRADLVLGVGPLAAALVEEARATGCREVQHVPDAATAAGLIASRVRDGDALLVKGSRGIGLEAVIEALVKARG